MLDAFIIEKIKEREREKQDQDNRLPLYIEEVIPEPKEKEDSKKEPVVIQL